LNSSVAARHAGLHAALAPARRSSRLRQWHREERESVFIVKRRIGGAARWDGFEDRQLPREK
jgi:hypothetical protein